MEIDITTIRNIPVFTVQDNGIPWKRVYGATKNRKDQIWMFPAYPPFLSYVLNDLNVICPDLIFTTEAKAWCASAATMDEMQTIADARVYKGPYAPYEHQKIGVAELLYNYRWILRWEMGTGKTRVPIDALDILKENALVLCPLIAADNWVDEIRMHSEDTLTARVMKGTVKQKLKIMEEKSDVTAFIVTYDTARRYGVPTLYREVWSIFEAANMYPTDALKNTLRRTNSKVLQTQYAAEWVKGRYTRDITKELKAQIGDTPQWLTDLNFQVVICDESHRFKSMDSMRTTTILELVKTIPRRWWLTGTITLGDPRDLYPQLRGLARFLAPESYSEYTTNHVVKSKTNHHVVLGYKGIHLLNRRVNRCSSERLLSECVDLPGRRDINFSFEMTKEQLRDYNSAVQEMQITLTDSEHLDMQNGAIRLTKLLQICSGFLYRNIDTDICDDCEHVIGCVEHGILPGSKSCKKKDLVGSSATRETLRYPTNPKLKALNELLNDILNEKKNKIIIWANFMAEMDDIEQTLKKANIDYVRIDGSNSKNVQVYAKKFQTDPECRVYLGQIKTGIAITLTAAAYVIYYSRSWSSEDWEQSRGRNYRIGQKTPVVIYRLVARDSVEETQLHILDNRKDIAEALTSVISCLRCSKYSECVINGTKPWTKECILKTTMPRLVTKTKVIYPKKTRTPCE